MIKGIVNERLVPIVRLKIKRKDGEWENLSFLLDTGFNRDIMLDPDLLDRYNMATQPDHRLLTPEEVLKSDENWKPRAPYTGTMKWEDRERTTGIRLVPGSPVDGMLGTELLKYRRLTVDVVEDGDVTIGSIPPRSSKIIPPWPPRRTKPELHFGGDLEEYLRWSGSYLPWTTLKVQDSEGQFKPLWVNVDTGDSQELSLPTRLVERLGLKATGKCRIHTTKGWEEVDRGNANIIWRGKELPVKWIQRSNEHPPLVGMKLFKGTTITVDFEDSAPIAEIRRIPEPPRSVWGILGSLVGRFRS